MVRQLNLKVGFTCNNNCSFCYLTDDEKKLGDRGTEEIKKDLFLYRQKGVSDVAFGGGEPSIREDIIKLVSYAKRLGYDRIELVTNGRMFYYADFCFRIVESGANYFVITLAGHRAEVHDPLVGVDGAFYQVVSGIKNLKRLDQRVVINSVITKQNYRFLPEFVGFLVDLGVDQVQLAFPLISGNAYRNLREVVPLKSEIMPYLHKALDQGSYAGIRIMVEAYPFCFLRGYEGFHCSLFVPEGHVSLRNVAGRITGTCGEPVKDPMCRECRFELICEGPWREYPEIFGWGEFKPVPGKKIKDLGELNLLTKKS